MANADTPRGLIPIKLTSGVAMPLEYLRVTSSYTTDIGVGTPVVQTAGGYIQPVGSATAANQSWVGVSMEFYDASEEGTKDIGINTDPQQKYLVQYSGSTALAQSVVGASCGFTTPAGVNTTTELSSTEVALIGTTGAAPLRIVGKHNRTTNAWGLLVDLIVQPITGLHQRAGESGV